MGTSGTKVDKKHDAASVYIYQEYVLMRTQLLRFTCWAPTSAPIQYPTLHLLLWCAYGKIGDFKSTPPRCEDKMSRCHHHLTARMLGGTSQRYHEGSPARTTHKTLKLQCSDADKAHSRNTDQPDNSCVHLCFAKGNEGTGILRIRPDLMRGTSMYHAETATCRQGGTGIKFTRRPMLLSPAILSLPRALGSPRHQLRYG